MHPPSSSTSSSDVLRASLWFVVFLAAFELAVWLTFTHTPLKEGALRTYFWYGLSYEEKLRALAQVKDPPPRSIIFAGWIDREAVKDEPADADVTVYGSSFAGNVATAMKEQRPALKLRFFGAPGAPLNHIYGTYELDRTLRKTRLAVIGVVSENVKQVLTMNVGSLYPDTPMPYFFPRYDLVNGKIERTGSSLVNSRAELLRAIEDPVLWRRQLEVLAVHDDAYRRYLFAADPLDRSAIARVARRGLGKSHGDGYLKGLYNRAGYDRNAYAVQVFRALLVRMIDDLRGEGVQPIVVLFATNGFDDHLHALLADLLAERKVPYVNTFEVCPSTDRGSFVPDGHFTPPCDRETAARTLTLVDAALSAAGK